MNASHGFSAEIGKLGKPVAIRLEHKLAISSGRRQAVLLCVWISWCDRRNLNSRLAVRCVRTSWRVQSRDGSNLFC